MNGYVKNVYWTALKVSFSVTDCNGTGILSTDFRKILKYQISWKSVQREQSCSVRTDRRTDMTKLRVAFSNFVNASESAEEVSTPVDSTCFNGDRVGQLNISRTAQGRNWVGTPTWFPYRMSKWKWPVGNSYECDRLDLYRYGNF